MERDAPVTCASLSWSPWNRSDQKYKVERAARWQKARAEERPEEVQRWTAKRHAALVVSLLRGEPRVAAAARRHSLKVAEVEAGRERFLLGAENALRARPQEDEALREEEGNRRQPKVGELTLDLDILREAAKVRPTRPRRSTE